MTCPEARMPGFVTNNLSDFRPKPVPILRHSFLVETESQGGVLSGVLRAIGGKELQ